jgi:hypothetical protein
LSGARRAKNRAILPAWSTTSEIVTRQLETDPGPLNWTRIDAVGDEGAALVTAKRALDLT